MDTENNLGQIIAAVNALISSSIATLRQMMMIMMTTMTMTTMTMQVTAGMAGQEEMVIMTTMMVGRGKLQDQAMTIRLVHRQETETDRGPRPLELK